MGSVKKSLKLQGIVDTCDSILIYAFFPLRRCDRYLLSIMRFRTLSRSDRKLLVEEHTLKHIQLF